MKGTALQERENVRGRECVCYLVLLSTPLGTRWFVGVHNTVDGWMHVVGSTTFFWCGKYRHLPYCRSNVGAHNTVGVLTCLKGYKVSF